MTKHNRAEETTATSKKTKYGTMTARTHGVRRAHRRAIADFAATNGLMKRAAEDALEHLPLTVFPFRFDAEMYRKAVDLAVPFNKLVMAIVRDEDWLRETLKPLAENDPLFTGLLYSLYERYGTLAKARQTIRMGIFRSDYMVDDNTGENRLLQVELNTISAGLGGVSPEVARLHRYLGLGPMREEYTRRGLDKPEDSIPLNHSLVEIGKAMATAHRLYLEQQEPRHHHRIASEEFGVIFVVEPNEWNVVDQLKIEQRFLEETESSSFGRRPRVFRLTLPEIARRTRVEDSTHRLLLRLEEDAGEQEGRGGSEIEISLCYFRSGYAPPEETDSAKEAWWIGRELIESSLAIKCPDVAVHLIGSKKIQQKLAEPGQLERFVKDPSEVAALRSCFARQYSFPLPDAVLSSAIHEPYKWVLKPSREGGGNNSYGEDVARAVRNFPPRELASYVLMERIFPFVQPNTVFVRDGGSHSKSIIVKENEEESPSFDATCELGIYSVLVWEAENEVAELNSAAGYLLRTKVASANEGGVSHGMGAIDSLYLV